MNWRFLLPLAWVYMIVICMIYTVLQYYGVIA